MLLGTITDEEAALYARWYQWKQNLTVHIPEDMATDEQTHRNTLLHKITKSADDNTLHDEIWSSSEQKGYLFKKYKKWLAAASFIAVLSIGAAYWLKSDKLKTPAQIAQKDILPGKKGLKLTLEDGKEIMLDSVKDGLISVQNGVKIFKRNGELVYEGHATKPIYNKATTDVGRQYQITLPDHSKVWLNASSELTYPVAFDRQKRSVSLKGEAYFEVQHLNNNASFEVNIGNKSIHVLGTHFNIHAYKNEPNVVATLLKGSIAMQSDHQTQKINPNQEAKCPFTSNHIQVKNVDAATSILWMQQQFNFDNLTLDEIMKNLERWYGIQVIFENNADRTMTFAGSTPMNQNLSEVLNVLKLSGLHFKLINKSLTIQH